MQLDTPARACRFHPAHGALPRVRTTFAGDVRKPAVRTPTPKADPDAKQHATITNAWTIVSFFEPHGAMASFLTLACGSHAYGGMVVRRTVLSPFGTIVLSPFSPHFLERASRHRVATGDGSFTRLVAPIAVLSFR